MTASTLLASGPPGSTFTQQNTWLRRSIAACRQRIRRRALGLLETAAETGLSAVRVTTPGSPADQIDWDQIEAELPQPTEGSTHIAAYVRRSTDMEEQSLEIQRGQIDRYTRQRNWQVMDTGLKDWDRFVPR